MEVLERWLYPVPSPSKRVRQKPMEVLALGMSRSGTESLRQALFILGYDHVYHGFDVPESSPPSWEAWVRLARRKWGGRGTTAGETGITREDLDAIVGHCNAITDQQGAMFALEMAEAYPEAKVILNRRETGPWYRSVVSTFGVTMTGFKYHVLPYFSAQLYWRKRYYEEILEAYFHGSLVKNGSWVYREHCAKIRGLVPPDQFLEWEAKDGWEPLCKYNFHPSTVFRMISLLQSRFIGLLSWLTNCIFRLGFSEKIYRARTSPREILLT
jgi:hypothetical protein